MKEIVREFDVRLCLKASKSELDLLSKLVDEEYV